jgi:transcriptional regulator with XRE-family HTH domain
MLYADRIKLALARQGKSRKGLAAALGVSVQAVSQITRGITKSATAENNARAARYLECRCGLFHVHQSVAHAHHKSCFTTSVKHD